MNKRLTYIIISFLVITVFPVFGQIDKILKPVEINPPSPPLPYQQKRQTDEQLAAQYYRAHDFEKAVVLYKKLYESKNNTLYYTYYLFCLVQLEDYKTAEQLVKKQQKNHPYSLKYKVDLGYIYMESGEQRKASKQFDQAIKNIPDNKARIVELANAFLYRNQSEYAVQVYENGNQKIDYPFYMELGNLYRQLRNNEKMIDNYLNHVDYNPGDISRVQSRLQSIIHSDIDTEIGKYLRVALLYRVQKDPGKLYFAEMLQWLSIQNKDFEMALVQAKSIDRRNNEDGIRLYELANICLSNESYEVAIEAYETIIKKGQRSPLYVDARIGALYAHYLKVTKTRNYSEQDLTDLEDAYLSTLEEYGKNASTIVIMRYLGHLQGFYLNKHEEAIDLLWQAVSITNANDRYVAESKLELADVLLLTGDVWEAKLLYSQVEKSFKNDPLGYDAKFKNAKLSFYIGEYAWAKAQLDVLKAATSKLIANDALYLAILIDDNLGADSISPALDMYAKADLFLYQNNHKKALKILDSILQAAKWHSIFDEAILKKAEINIALGNYNEAAINLTDIVENYSYDITADNALYMLAQLNETQLNNPDEAKILYQRLLTDYPGSVFVVNARNRFRYLRGDLKIDEMTQEELFFYDLLPINEN